jgi:tetratricopeptide (TPR) repeat protein
MLRIAPSLPSLQHAGSSPNPRRPRQSSASLPKWSSHATLLGGVAWLASLAPFAAGLAGCASQDRPAVASDQPARLFDGMGQHQRAITTSSPDAQRYFDQGLIWAYAFNHDEAIRSFTHAARLDPQCAMAWWGVALCHGPHINNPVVPPERARAAWEALRKALALQDHANPTERALIAALAKRYADPPPDDRRPLDEAYADALREVWENHRGDADIGSLYAEALMNLQPWDLWTRDGQPKGRTQEILAVLESVRAIDPSHPGANHLYIHAVEASPHPERGIEAADRLRDAVPIAGHLVHMPSHIDVQVGRWALASQQNERAIEADRTYRTISPRQGFYRIYMLHNHHMLSFASMMEGRCQAAVAAARAAVGTVPKDYAKRQAALVDPYMGAVYDALKRFGRWDEILAEPAPPSYLPITTAMWRFTRGLASAAKGQLDDARKERARFERAAAKVPAEAMMAINPAGSILRIAAHMLDGEIAYRRGDIDEAVAELRKAIALEDELVYMEPPEWIQPVRHTLGAVLVDAGRFAEAEKVYREDLAIWPENGWSLYGLAQCVRARGAEDEAQAVEQRFAKTWARADVKLESSCFCTARLAAQ